MTTRLAPAASHTHRRCSGGGVWGAAGVQRCRRGVERSLHSSFLRMHVLTAETSFLSNEEIKRRVNIPTHNWLFGSTKVRSILTCITCGTEVRVSEIIARTFKICGTSWIRAVGEGGHRSVGYPPVISDERCWFAAPSASSRPAYIPKVRVRHRASVDMMIRSIQLYSRWCCSHEAGECSQDDGWRVVRWRRMHEP